MPGRVVVVAAAFVQRFFRLVLDFQKEETAAASKSRTACLRRLTDGGPHRPTLRSPGRRSAPPARRADPAVSGFLEPLVAGGWRRDGGGRRRRSRGGGRDLAGERRRVSVRGDL
ncbi:hypothetical protein GUJ93_ZPchr0004g38662 [Zizania palustris]|uniref:Uncharacterized protein n=1 Tax=Zizania palustris TaxID=103762 RepID=A0A8J5VGF6_ZIZPA|nr:hypothetical protein GUJ93_ZPchr0004g38662 [Zizania palustris]